MSYLSICISAYVCNLLVTLVMRKNSIDLIVSKNPLISRSNLTAFKGVSVSAFYLVTL